jgi:hypothetical protein
VHRGWKTKTETPKPARRAKARLAQSKNNRAQSAHKPAFFTSPCAPPSSAGWSGDFGEDCLSAQREFRSRLTSRATQGTHEVGGKPGAPSFGYFSWQDKKSNLLPGNPRRFSMGIALLKPSYAC